MLVDDTVHTGKTLKIAKEQIIKKGAKQVKSVSINYVNKISSDYFLIKGGMKFPWSKNSSDYEKFKTYINNI